MAPEVAAEAVMAARTGIKATERTAATAKVTGAVTTVMGVGMTITAEVTEAMVDTITPIMATTVNTPGIS